MGLSRKKTCIAKSGWERNKGMTTETTRSV